MKAKLLIVLAVLGAAAGIISAYLSTSHKPPLAPLFSPARDPYVKGVYANGIIESYQSHASDIDIFPEVSGTVVKLPVIEGATVSRGTTILVLDYSVQKATVEQQKAQAAAALAMLNELKAQPRKETLAVSKAQVTAAQANLQAAKDDLALQQKSFSLNPRSVSKKQLIDAIDAAKVAEGNLGTAVKSYELTRAGAWIFDIQNQEHLYESLSKTWEAGKALLAKYTIRAPADGVVLSVNATLGSYVSTAGTYDTYTQGYTPAVVMARAQPWLQVRCYVDEILIPRLPPPSQMAARMFIRGSNISVPLEFVRLQPYVTPKIELSNERTEKVDVRVLPVLFRFKPPKDVHVYPGQLVDVYLQAGNGGRNK
ncbi:MAG: biotin/lipoyl-binding protein [Syntrophobacteraceae bacterium]|nr:biotin/lipoyl-binding protein [Syntrophobacteraceae bacterium]